MRKKHVLVAMLGTSPAVLTETVYALHKRGDTPDEVRIVTTLKGKETLKKELLGEQKIWGKMQDDIGTKISLGDASFELFKDKDNNHINDITSSEDNELMADTLLEFLRGFTNTSDCRISFSIAGGRKTMSAIGTLIMSLVGRKDDQLFHILVNEPFDKKMNPPFYYPSSQEHEYNGIRKKGTEAKLQLAEIPYVRMRYWFDEKKAMDLSYNALVSKLNEDTESYGERKVQIDPPNHQVYIVNETLGRQKEIFNYVEAHLFWMLAERKKGGEPALEGENALRNSFENFLKRHRIELEEKKSLQGKGRYSIRKSDLENLVRIFSSMSKKLEDISWPIKNEKGKYGLENFSKDQLIILEMKK